MDSLITATGACTRGGRSPRRIEAGGPARRPAGARASRHRHGAARRSRSSEGPAATCCACLRSERGGGAHTRCVVAEAEVALVSRDLGWPAKALDVTLEERGDRVNAEYARYLEVRRLLLIGRIEEAERTLAELDPAPFPPAARIVHELVVAEIAMRRLRTKAAHAALAPADARGGRASIPRRAGPLRACSRSSVLLSTSRSSMSESDALPFIMSCASTLTSLIGEYRQPACGRVCRAVRHQSGRSIMNRFCRLALSIRACRARSATGAREIVQALKGLRMTSAIALSGKGS
jgi:hypothetical protein